MADLESGRLCVCDEVDVSHDRDLLGSPPSVVSATSCGLFQRRGDSRTELWAVLRKDLGDHVVSAPRPHQCVSPPSLPHSLTLRPRVPPLLCPDLPRKADKRDWVTVCLAFWLPVALDKEVGRRRVKTKCASPFLHTRTVLSCE